MRSNCLGYRHNSCTPPDPTASACAPPVRLHSHTERIPGLLVPGWNEFFTVWFGQLGASPRSIDGKDVANEANRKIDKAGFFMTQHRFDGPEEHSRKEEIPEINNDPEPEPDRPAVAHLPGIATQLIGERMRSMYASMVREPVPEELLQLIHALNSKEGSE